MEEATIAYRISHSHQPSVSLLFVFVHHESCCRQDAFYLLFLLLLDIDVDDVVVDDDDDDDYDSVEHGSIIVDLASSFETWQTS